MIRKLSAAIVVGGIAMIAFAQPPLTKDNAGVRKPEPMSKSEQVRQLLDTEVDIPQEFRSQAVPLSVVIRYLVNFAHDKGKSLPISVNEATFKEEVADAPAVYDTPVRLSPFVKTMTIREMLQAAAAEATHPPPAILVRDGRVEIVNRSSATVGKMLGERVSLVIREKPLVAAIQEVTDKTGLTIQVDPRCLAEVGSSISLRTEGDTTVRGVLASWADLFELKLVEDADRVLLMPRTDYMKKLRAEAEEAKLNAEIRAAKGPANAIPKVENKKLPKAAE